MAPYPNGHFDMVADAELDSLLNTLESSIKIFRTEAAECGIPPPSARYSHPLEYVVPSLSIPELALIIPYVSSVHPVSPHQNYSKPRELS